MRVHGLLVTPAWANDATSEPDILIMESRPEATRARTAIWSFFQGLGREVDLVPFDAEVLADENLSDELERLYADWRAQAEGTF